jgi:hypothetical protein
LGFDDPIGENTDQPMDALMTIVKVDCIVYFAVGNFDGNYGICPPRNAKGRFKSRKRRARDL